ncbi:unnamed protein product [Toxocara canis]|uniref:ETS domain-containing protein n=1 Tax=Toxocara canis TaxID=6265 RepID=A0A183U017_TOXCA|nr:unnamed protein product [Toxocara canis]
MSETEQISAERESELDLSRILAELSPMPQVAEDAQTRRPEQLPSIAPQEIRHDQEFPMLRREPSNEERITFLRGCSPATLWHFLLDCLSRPAHFNNVCAWTKNAWQFCITHTKRFTEKWDEYNHNKQAVSYGLVDLRILCESVRALKSFENTQFCGLTLLGRETSRRNTFRFLPSHDSPHIPCVQYEFQASPSTVECVVRQQTPFTKANTLLTPAHSRHNEAIGTNYSPNFEFRARSRVSAKRPMEMCSIEMPLARPIKNYRSDERQLSFLPQPPGMVSSTPVRDRTVPMMGFGRELTNTNPWSYQYMSFSQTAFPSGKNSQNHWANQSPSTYQPNVPLWGYSGSPLPYQVSDSNIQGRTYGAFRNRTPIEFSTPAQPTTYTNENQSNYSFMNNSNDSAFYDDTQSPHSLFEPTHYTSFADGGSAQQEGVQGKNSYSGSGTHHP